jgi:hypothetical protein
MTAVDELWFRRNRRGNLICFHRDLLLTVFEWPNGSGRYSWSMRDQKGPTYCPDWWTFSSEKEAVGSLQSALRGEGLGDES